MENLSQLLSALRIQKRLSQEYVAQKLGLSQSQYSKIESGQKDFPLGKLTIFAVVVGVEPLQLLEYLLTGAAKPEEAIRRLTHQINNRPLPEDPAEDSQKEEYRILAAHFEKKYFLLYREYLKLYEERKIKDE